MFVEAEQTTVYRAGKRRYLNRRSAYMAIARTKYDAKHKRPRCSCVEDHEDATTFDEEMDRVVNRFARLMAHYDRVEKRGKR